ncbi:hypothetical protein KUTeg_003190 [Tegillarca granosa]|uniref:Uncharacterized protein n=1 Tax=Tegillarca granosa TaxID=220873 RepID=A0ABQ9FLE8_TEGGR|nr:hypothetical protein KUTeg_003190 [Tegillarca granosa]
MVSYYMFTMLHNAPIFAISGEVFFLHFLLLSTNWMEIFMLGTPKILNFSSPWRVSHSRLDKAGLLTKTDIARCLIFGGLYNDLPTLPVGQMVRLVLEITMWMFFVAGRDNKDKGLLAVSSDVGMNTITQIRQQWTYVLNFINKM